jgi:hypothetical protein
VLQAAPYNLRYGDPIVFTVNCFNQYGWSMVSPTNYDGAATVPSSLYFAES